MCTQKRIFWSFLINRYGIPADLLTSVLHLCSCEFFSDLWGRSLWGPLLRAQWLLVWLRRFVWISPGLWFCDRSEIESKSSRFRCLPPRRLIASNLGRYKAIYPLFAAKLSLFLNLLSWRSGHPCDDSYRHLSLSFLCLSWIPAPPTTSSLVELGWGLRRKVTISYQLQKNGIFWDISFFWDYILEKQTLTSLDNYSTHLPSTGITF